MSMRIDTIRAAVVAQQRVTIPTVAQVKANLERIMQPDQRTLDGREALDRMKQATEEQRKSAKAAAKLKVEFIKKQLQMLRQFGGDPKAVARQAAYLARQLRAAVREYSSGQQQEAGGANTEAAAADSEAKKAETDAGAAEAEAQEAEAEAAEAEAQADQGEEEPNGQQADGEEEQRAAPYQTNDPAAAEARADQEFLQDAKTLLRQIKAVIAAARDKMKKGSPEGEDAVKAAHEAEAAISDAMPNGPVISVTV